jgi:hypothetical protein
MAFMEQQVEFGQWVVVDTNCGGCVLPADLVDVDKVKRWAESDSPWAKNKLAKLVGDYIEGTEIYSVEIKAGWGGRLSAPGYMDCTEWSVYDTEEEALEELTEMYGDDDADDADDADDE